MKECHVGDRHELTISDNRIKRQKKYIWRENINGTGISI